MKKDLKIAHEGFVAQASLKEMSYISHGEKGKDIPKRESGWKSNPWAL